MRDNMQICRIYKNKLRQALELVWQVFVECDSEDYEETGVRTFEHFIRYENMKEMMDAGELVFFGAYESSCLIGVIAMRSGFHISLLFVTSEYQRRGVAKRLVRRAAAYCMDKNPMLRYLTVNASPKGLPAYLAMGFEPLSEELKKEGMRYTLMRIGLR